MAGHEYEENFFWTSGHSFENYFLDEEIFSGAFCFLTASIYKKLAKTIFCENFEAGVRLIAILTLSSKDIEKSGFPIGAFDWKDIKINENGFFIEFESWMGDTPGNTKEIFLKAFRKNEGIVNNSSYDTALKICRGHTAVKLEQKIFALCIYEAGREENEGLAIKDANSFCQMQEKMISTALCEKWLEYLCEEKENYPAPLVERVV